MAILPTLTGPADLRGLSDDQLAELAAEIRETIVSTVAHTGGHLGSSLGVVELTIALHRLLESPRDRIVWDTGHQAYPHKLLTGRLERFGTLRQIDGVGGFPRRAESPHDVFDGGHAGTGLSIGEGLATARDLQHGLERIAVVVGDAALMSGLSLEALNDIGQRQTRMLIVLNDNEMSISPTVGALSKYLSTIKLSTAWQTSKTAYDRAIERLPLIGTTALELSQRLRRSVVQFAQQPGSLFEDLGITYIGVVPGHDLRALEDTFGRALELRGPVLVHVRTQKGRGYRPAEADQVSFHGAALPPMAEKSRAPATPRSADPKRPAEGSAMPSESMADDAAPPTVAAAPRKPPNYTAVFVGELIEAARDDRRIVAITAGMPTGTGLNRFQAAYPERFIDVGIAEPHAVTLATGLAMGGQRPVVAIYSTFLQRAFDQTVHDVCQNDQAGPHRGRPCRARRRGRDEPPGHVHDPGPAPVAEPRRRQPEGRAGVALDGPHRARPGPSVRAPLPARCRASTCRRSSRDSCRSGRARSSGKGATSSWSASGRSSRGRWRPPTSSPRRAGRSGSSTPASPSPSTAS